MYSISCVNIELTSLCGHCCWCCGRRKVEKEYKHLTLEYGNMDFELLKRIEKQIPPNVVCAFHNNGCPLEYPMLEKALKLFKNRIRVFNTKGGKLLLEKVNEIINNMETLTISMIPKDYEWEEQYKYLKKFLEIKGIRKPRVIIRCTGDIEKDRVDLYNGLVEKHNCLIVKRILHSPMGSFNYEKEIIKPEHGICLDFLTHPAININGDVSICVRFDPERLGVLGNLKEQTLKEIWNGKKRKGWLECHIAGQRDAVPLCSGCHFWGVPRG